MSNAISAQGTILERAPQATPTAFVVVANLMDLTPPPLTRKPLDTTAHSDLEEQFVVGIRRKGEMSMKLGFLMSETSHGATSGLVKAWMDGDRSIYRITFPDATKWVFSGYVTNVGPAAPVDDLLVADVSIRPTNTMSYF
jgi:hypothetical protein